MSQALNLRMARFERAIQSHFAAVYFEIENESAQHSDHYSGDGESHWRILIVAPEFTGLSRVQRHQKFNQLVQDEFAKGLHALSLQLLDPQEWETKKVSHFTITSEA